MFGSIVGVRRFTDSSIEVDFYHNDEIIKYRYSTDPNATNIITKELIESLADVLGTDICVEINFGIGGNIFSIEFEECDDSDDDEEYDED